MKHGEPAFPRPTYLELDPTRDSQGRISGDGGMSLRDYFAAKAMQSLILRCDGNADGAGFEEMPVRMAWHIADAMLVVREETTREAS